MKILDPKSVLRRLLSRTTRNEETGCLISNRPSVNHYGRNQMSIHGVLEYTSRIMWVLTNGAIPEDKFVLHTCDNPACIEIKHLFLGTQKQNMDDMKTKGRKCAENFFPQFAGEDHPMAKLTEADIPQIRSDQRPAWEIAMSFGVSKSQVARIKRRESWSHV